MVTPVGSDGAVVLAGRAVAYRQVEGEGTAIVALHGLGAHADFWQPLLAVATTEGCRRPIVCVDLPGHGVSSDLERYGDTAYADAVLALLDALDLTAPVLLGHSLGATVALVVAGRLDPAPTATVAMEIKTRWSDEELARMHAYADQPRKPMPPADARARFLRASGGGEAGPEWHDLLVDRGVRPAANQAVLANDPRTFAVVPPDLHALAAGANGPVTIVRAADSPATTKEDAGAVGPPVHQVPGGHNAHLTHPAELWSVIAEVARVAGVSAD